MEKMSVEEYIESCVENCFNCEGESCGCFTPWISISNADNAIKMAEKEMIEKALDWLDKHWRDYVWLTDGDVIHFGLWKDDFKKAMLEE